MFASSKVQSESEYEAFVFATSSRFWARHTSVAAAILSSPDTSRGSIRTFGCRVNAVDGILRSFDVGTPAHKTTVIDRGIYRGFLHSLETSGMLKARPTGNGRAQDFGRRVWVRMTNTYFGAGRDKKDEILEETKSGVLTRKWISGMEDPVGGSFQAVTQSGFRITKGEVGERVRGMTLTGNALSILKSVDRVSKEISLDGGSCGKGEEDYVPVAAGGPYMRCKIVVGGG